MTSKKQASARRRFARQTKGSTKVGRRAKSTAKQRNKPSGCAPVGLAAVV